MKTTLTKLDIQELLILAEDIYNDFLNKKPTLRACFWLDSNPSYKKAFDIIRHPHLYKEMMRLHAAHLVVLMLDDDNLHITFDASLLEGCELPIEIVEPAPPKKKLVITKTLELSTGNLSSRDCSTLSTSSFKSYVRSSEYGLNITVSEFHQKGLGMFDSLRPIMDFALENDIRYLNFDSDNEACEQFEVFDW